MSRFKGFQGIFRGLSGSSAHFSPFFPQAGVMTVPEPARPGTIRARRAAGHS